MIIKIIYRGSERFNNMPADIDVLVGGNSSLGFSTSYSYKSKVHQYDTNSDSSNSPYGSSCLDFPTALSSSPNSNTYYSHSPPPPPPPLTPSQLVGSSPTAPTHFTFHGRCSSPTLRSVPSSAAIINQFILSSSSSSSEDCQMPVAVPRRPCLVVRCDVLDIPSPNKSKKKVVFADDRGFPLTLVRFSSEKKKISFFLSSYYGFPFSGSNDDGTIKRSSTTERSIFW